MTSLYHVLYGLSKKTPRRGGLGPSFCLLKAYKFLNSYSCVSYESTKEPSIKFFMIRNRKLGIPI